MNNYQVAKTKPETDELCQTDLIAIKFWKWNSSITPDMEEYLTAQGYEDLRGTAKLYQRFYPSVLPPTFNDTYYQVGSITKHIYSRHLKLHYFQSISRSSVTRTPSAPRKVSRPSPRASSDL